MRWQKERDPLTPGREGGARGGVTLSLVGLLAVLLTLSSFLLWDGRESAGDVGRAVSYFEDFFSENEAIAVFLGWEGE